MFGGGDLKVTPGASGVNVDVAAGAALVQGDTIALQRLYHIANDATKNSATFEAGDIPAPSSTQARLDQIIARVWDHEADASGQRKWRLEVLEGGAASGATLDNRNGAAALPDSAVRLADVLVPQSATGLVATDIRDRRPWARGFLALRVADGSANFQTTSTSYVDISSQFPIRVECSGKPVELIFWAPAVSHSASNGRGDMRFTIDGVAVDPPMTVLGTERATAGNLDVSILHGILVPSAASHVFNVQYTVIDAGTLTVWNNFGKQPQFIVRELLQPLADNG